MSLSDLSLGDSPKPDRHWFRADLVSNIRQQVALMTADDVDPMVKKEMADVVEAMNDAAEALTLARQIAVGLVHEQSQRGLMARNMLKIIDAYLVPAAREE